MYAQSIHFCVADVSSLGRGQTHTVYGATSAQEAAQTTKLRGAGFIRYWLDNSRPSGAPQGYAGVAR
jgi:hypothetical protein